MASARRRGQKWTGLYRDASGAQRSAGTYDTEDEALARARVAEIDANPPEAEDAHPAARRGKVTVAGYAPGWLDNQILEDTSRATYGAAIKRIVRYLGAKTREDVEPDDVRKMLKALDRAGLADATISATLSVAKLLLGDAACAGVQYRIKDRREMCIATREQAKLIEQAIPERYRLFVRTAFATGCRWGEMLPIRGTDVEKRGSGYVLKVRRVITQIGGTVSERPYGKSPKAKRDITIPEDLALELMAYGNRLCFTNARGGYLRRSDFRSHFWKPACNEAGLPDLRVHDMRHSAISWWANAGIQLSAVRDRAGHSNISVTSRYIHVIPGDDDPFIEAAA
jgi:integrase